MSLVLLVLLLGNLFLKTTFSSIMIGRDFNFKRLFCFQTMKASLRSLRPKNTSPEPEGDFKMQQKKQRKAANQKFCPRLFRASGEGSKARERRMQMHPTKMAVLDQKIASLFISRTACFCSCLFLFLRLSCSRDVFQNFHYLRSTSRGSGEWLLDRKLRRSTIFWSLCI